MAERPPVQQQPERITTPEKNVEELYLDALEKKRDTLLAFHTMNSFRKSKDFEEMTSEELEQYKILREDWRSKKENSFGSFENLPVDKQEELAAMGSRLYDVQAKLTLLGSSVSEVPVAEAEKPAVAEKPESALTLEDVDDQIARFERSTPVPLLALEAWKAKRVELAERQEAEASPDQTSPKGFLAKVKDAFNRVRGVGLIKESRMNPLGLREIPQVQAIPETSSEQREAEPQKATKWGWFKERAKGVWNFGIWEFHQAERFRSKTREVAEDAKALAMLIEEERDMTLEAAEKESWEIVNELKLKGLDVSAPEFYQVASELSEKKRKENDEEVEYIIRSAGNDLLDKLQKYRGQAGQDVLTEENKIAFQNDLRAELNKLRSGFLKQYTVDLAKIMRDNLDENWWRRYIWGTANAAMGFAGVKFLTVKAADWLVAIKMAQAEKAAMAGGKAVEAGAGTAQEFITQKMHENIWTTLKEMAQNDHQHLNLSDHQLMDLSKKVLDTNGIYESEWVNNVVEGLRSSRTLPEGMPLKIPAEVMGALGY